MSPSPRIKTQMQRKDVWTWGWAELGWRCTRVHHRVWSRWGSCLQPRQLGSGLRDDLGRWGREGREAQGGGGVCAHTGKHHTLLCDAKEHGTVERLYSFFFFLKGYTPFCGLSRKSTPLPFLASACCRLTLGSGPASSTAFCASPPSSVLSLQHSSSSSPTFKSSHRQTGIISLF